MCLVRAHGLIPDGGFDRVLGGGALAVGSSEVLGEFASGRCVVGKACRFAHSEEARVWRRVASFRSLLAL